MNKQELKEAVGELNLVDTVFDVGGVSYIDTAVRVMQVYDLIDQLDEPEVLSQEVPVIPKFVADWIEEIKPVKSLRVAFEYIAQRKADNHDDPLAFWIEEGNSETFARAWLGGFHVEVEQKYYARLKEVHPPEKEWLTNLSGPNYYAIDTIGLGLGEFVLDLVGMTSKASAYTLKDWERHGINDSNADFVKVV